MNDLETELPDIAGDIRQFAKVHSGIKEALADFDTACEFEAADQTSASEKSEWARIRKETADELRRLMSRLRQTLGDVGG
jgi:hypothetical protein